MKKIVRQDHLKQLQNQEFDILVVGGGATGAGVARDAALRGLKVALVEKSDFASGTSMHSTKLLHGGLRYLKNYEFGLVREAALERKVHLEIAPHLSETLDFIIPLYSWSEDKPFLLRLALFVYDFLAFPRGIGKNRYLSGKKLIEMEPILENEDIKSGGVYQDVKTDDARLVLSNILDAIELNATILNYCELLSWTKKENGVVSIVKDLESDQQIEVKSKTLIICGGPWTEILEDRGNGFDGQTKLRLTWGAHLMLKKRLDRHPILMVNEDGRPVFLIPRLDYDLAGTTDIDYNGHPDDIKPTKEDVDYILNALNNIFPIGEYDYSDVVASFSGLRPLVYQKGITTGKVSRNHEIFTDNERMITIAGGKLTTYRVMAKEGVDKAVKLLGLRKRKYKATTSKRPLMGGDIDDWNEFVGLTSLKLKQKYNFDEKQIHILQTWYGSSLPIFEEILTEIGKDRIIETRPWLRAQVIFACRFEYARHPIDFMRRRTQMMLEEGNGIEALPVIVELMSTELGWNEDERLRISQETIAYIESFIKVKLN